MQNDEFAGVVTVGTRFHRVRKVPATTIKFTTVI